MGNEQPSARNRNNKNKHQSQYNRGKTSHSSTKKKTESQAVWNCPICTFENQIKDEICQMCYNGDRPSVQQCGQCKEYIVKSDFETHRLSHRMEQLRLEKQREEQLKRQREQRQREEEEKKQRDQRAARAQQQRRLQRTDSQEKIATILGVFTANALGFEFVKCITVV